MATQVKVNNILCIGGGSLGLPVAKHFAPTQTVSLLKRSPLHETASISVVTADISQPTHLAATLPDCIDIILYCLSPSEFTEAGYQQVFLAGTSNLLAALERRRISPRRIFFVSSTSVYHQNSDNLVSETSPAMPTSFSGKTLLETENFLLKSGIPTTVIRFSGIYGGNRTRLIEQALKGELTSQVPGAYTNRINEADCIEVLKHLMQKEIDGEKLENIYLATDCAPVRTNQLAQWFRDKVMCLPEKPGTPPPRRRAGSKRCSNQRLLDSGYQFIYPTWAEGYTEMIERLYAEKIHPSK